MKSLKIWSLLAVLAVAITGCGDDNKGGDAPAPLPEGVSLVKEWRIATWNGSEAPFDVYIDFNEDGSYDMYQQIYTLNYQHFSGSYNLSGDIVTGSYSDGTNWKSGYKVALSADGMQLTMHSQEDVSMTAVYNSTIIPEDVKAEAAESRAVDVERFL